MELSAAAIVVCPAAVFLIAFMRGRSEVDLRSSQDPAEAQMAYDRNETEDLDEAQRRKIDHIIRKLQIRRGMRVLDIG